MTLLAVWVGKSVLAMLRLAGRSGNALPGLIVEKLFPRYLPRTLAALPQGVVVISGTNGKTTTTKMVAAALRGVLSDRAREGAVHVVDTFVSGDKPSTKTALQALETVEGRRVLVVLTRDDSLAWLSLRNVSSVHVIAADQLNAYDVVVADDVVFTAAALEVFVAGPAKGKSVKAVATESEAKEADK